MEESSQKAILEAREEIMVSPSEGEPIKRIAHFIKPSKTSIKDPIFGLPLHSLSKPTPTSEPKNWSLEVNFAAWRFHLANWKEWVDKMASTHKATWEKVGIFQPIMSSTYEIRRDCNLVFGLAEKWCSETNTFVFSWGEATITLEDLMVSGYSVLGSPVFSPLETEKFKGIEEQLNNARLEMNRTTAKKASHHLWLKKFMDSGCEIEHEAFLALWLSRYIFPITRDSVGNHVFSIAIHLARGIRIALAPAVLASIYRDLNLLKSKIIESAMCGKKQKNEEVLRITMWSPFQFVQIWAWERFVDLQPRPNYLNNNEPRLARWDKLSHRVENLRLVLDSSKESFNWRPYCRPLKNWNFAKFYGENEMLVPVVSGLDEELESFARCLRVSPLVGLDFVEWYFPHRISMQFGFDQDLPGCVDKQIDSPEIAWSKYCRPIGDVQLHIPSRNFKADVTTRYVEWWKISMLSLRVAGEGVLRKQKSSTGSGKKQKSSKDKNENNKLLSEVIAKSLNQKKALKSFKKFNRVLKCSKRVKDGIGISRSGLLTCGTTEDNALSSFTKKRKVSEEIKEGYSVSLPSKIPKMSSKYPKRENFRDASSASRIALKQSKISEIFPLRKKSTKELAGSMKRKMDGNGALCLSSSSLKTSEKLAARSKTEEEDASEKLAASLKRVDGDSDASGSLVGPSKIKIMLPLNSVEMQKLINSPFPPGFPPKSIRVEEATDSIEDALTIAEIAKSRNKQDDAQHKESGNVDNSSNQCPSHSKNHPSKCSLHEARNSILEEDEVTVMEMWSSYKKPEVIEKGQGGHVSSNESKSHSSSMAYNETAKCIESMTASTEMVPDSGDENSSGQSQSLSSSTAICSTLESPQSRKTTTEEAGQCENVENKQDGGDQNSTTQTESHLSSTEVNDQLRGNEDESLIHSGKPHHRNPSTDCKRGGIASKFDQKYLETEVLLRRVEKMISGLKAARSGQTKRPSHCRQSK